MICLPPTIDLRLPFGLFWVVWKKGGHGGNCFTVVLRDLSYREENDVFDSFEELKRGELGVPH